MIGGLSVRWFSPSVQKKMIRSMRSPRVSHSSYHCRVRFLTEQDLQEAIRDVLFLHRIPHAIEYNLNNIAIDCVIFDEEHAPIFVEFKGIRGDYTRGIGQLLYYRTLGKRKAKGTASLVLMGPDLPEAVIETCGSCGISTVSLR